MATYTNGGPASNLRSRKVPENSSSPNRHEEEKDSTGSAHGTSGLGTSDNQKHAQKTDVHLSSSPNDKIDEIRTFTANSGKTATPPLGFRHWLLVVSYVFATYALVLYLDSRLPRPIPPGQFERFSEKRARDFLEELTSYGPRPSGSHACEVLATDLFLEELQTVKKGILPIHRMDLEIQRPSDCFELDFLTEFTLCYRNITNIVVRLGAKSSAPAAKHSVLVNCHYDTVPDSPGATDDGVSCAILLEVLKIFSQQEKPLENDIIFLFNGAEENILQAAHGFITQHPWRHSIRAFINLEGAGAGGRELLFQAGPGNGWLLLSYLQAAPYPHCSILGQEMFQSGFVPSDTDFRIFRDYGRIPGLDIAYIKNGYLYHTEFDRPEFINEGSIQRAGENVLETLRHLVSSPYLAHPGDFNEGRFVYLDMAGLFMICYHQSLGVFLNYTAVLLVILKIVWNCQFSPKQIGASSAESGYGWKDIGLALLVHFVVSGAIFLAVVFGMSRAVWALGLTLVWYGHPWYLIPVYFAPGLILGFTIHGYIASKIVKKKDPLVVERAYFDAMIFIFAGLLFVLTWIGIGSAFFLLVHVASPLLRGILHTIYKRFWPEADRCPKVLLFCHLVALFPICFMGCYVVLMTLEVFVPMMGRTGQSHNPETFIAAIIAMTAVSTTLYTSSLIVISRKLGYFIQKTAVVTMLFLILLLTTGWGVPYKWDPEAPRLRRVHVAHLSRRIYAPDGTAELKDNGLWVASFDYRGSEDLPAHTFLQGSKVPDCGNDSYCNIPYYVPVERMLLPEASRWVTLPNAPKFPKLIEVKMVGKDVLARQRLNITFEVDGPDHLTMFLTPFGPWAIESWSLTKRRVFPPGTRFIYAAYGRYSSPWKFWLTLRPTDVVSADVSKKQLKFSVGSHIIHGENMKSDTLQQIVKLIKERRSDRGDLAIGWWKWAITPQAWNNEYVSQYY